MWRNSKNRAKTAPKNRADTKKNFNGRIGLWFRSCQHMVNKLPVPIKFVDTFQIVTNKCVHIRTPSHHESAKEITKLIWSLTLLLCQIVPMYKILIDVSTIEWTDEPDLVEQCEQSKHNLEKYNLELCLNYNDKVGTWDKTEKSWQAFMNGLCRDGLPSFNYFPNFASVFVKATNFQALTPTCIKQHLSDLRLSAEDSNWCWHFFHLAVVFNQLCAFLILLSTILNSNKYSIVWTSLQN